MIPYRPVVGAYLGIYVMQKFVTAWIKNPTLANAIKIQRHAKSHPMSILMLDAAGHAHVAIALDTIEGY